MKKIILIVLLSGIWSFGSDNGRFAGSYTRIGIGARSMAMGGTGVAAPNRGYAFYYNPALSGKMDRKVFSAESNFLSLDRYVNFIGFSVKVPPGAGLSVGWLVSGTGNLNSYNSIGQNTGKINHSAHAIYAAFARHLTDKLSIGVNLKVLLEYINDGTSGFDYASRGFGGDIGVFYQAMQNLSIGAVYKDIGSKLSANTEKLFARGGVTTDKFPQLFRIGAFYHTPLKWLNVAYDVEMSSVGKIDHHIGVEAIHGRNLSFRIGANNSRFTAGAGFDFRFRGFTSLLDYAFVSSAWGEGSSHLFSWEVYF